MLSALAFNICLVLLPLAAAAALIVINRDQLFAYEYSAAGARAISARVARLNGDLIQLDFDRQRQWDDLVSMELSEGDPAAARGFLLSAEGMLPRRSVSVLANADNDAELERAALVLLTPATRARYEANVPMLSSRATPTPPDAPLGDRQDFELMAHALMEDPQTDPLQFVLTGFTLGLAGDMGPRRTLGAIALLTASRRDDYPVGLAAEIGDLFAAAAPVGDFRAAALAGANDRNPSSFDIAGPAFSATLNAADTARAREVLDTIGAIAEATSPSAATAMLTHASTLQDLQRLRLLAQATGDRVAAAAKRLPRDGSLLAAARGELSMTRDLLLALVVAGAALIGLIGLVFAKLFRAAMGYLKPAEDEYSHELVDLSTSNFRPL